MDYEVEVRALPAQQTVSKRISVERSELAERMGEALRETLAYLKERGVEPSGPPYSQYYAFGATTADLECGWPVAKRVDGTGLIQAGKLAGGKVAVSLHQGPYEALVRAHQATHGYLHQHGTVAGGMPREVYLTGPGETDDAGEWRTEVIWPMR